MQKWTGTADNSPSSEAVENIDICEDTAKHSEEPVPKEQTEVTLNDTVSGSNQPRLWSAGSFLNKVRGFEGFHSDQEDSRLSVGNIKLLGKAKINEFYDKVRINKARFDNLKRRGSMDKSGSNISESNISETDENDVQKKGGEGIGLSSTQNSFNNTKEDISLSDSLEVSENNDSLFVTSRKMPLAIIGRSSTSCGCSSSTNQIETNELQPPPKPTMKSNKAQKHLLGNIGRSFSEQNDDENSSSFILNERSRSYSHVEEDGQTSKNSNDSDNNIVSSSLPTFFGLKSVPVSPVPLHKGVMSREASLSDSSRRKSLLRDSSVQSDSSHCSSVESLLEARKPDPEAILINLGFGPAQSEDVISKIPKRFLKPSQVRGIDIETFLRQQQMANHLHDHSVLGYRGLLGNPDIPPSLIVAKIMERFERNERNRCIMDINLNRPQSAPPTPGPNQ